MNSPHLQAFVDRRMKALATVFLTGRSDVHLFEIEQDFGVDLLVRLGSQRDDQEQIFGVILKGTASTLDTKDEAAKHLNLGKSLPRDARRFSFPVIELIFSMDGDKGYFAWRFEPLIAETGAPKLVPHEILTCQPTDRRALDEIVERVSHWYDNLYSLLLASR